MGILGIAPTPPAAVGGGGSQQKTPFDRKCQKAGTKYLTTSPAVMRSVQFLVRALWASYKSLLVAGSAFRMELSQTFQNFKGSFHGSFKRKFHPLETSNQYLSP